MSTFRILVIFIVVVFANFFGQYATEAPVVLINGERHTNLIHLKFSDNVDLPATKLSITLSKSKLLTSFPKLASVFINEFSILDLNLSNTKIKRSFTKLKRDSRTENAVRIVDRLDRIFTIRTAKLKNLEKLIQDIEALNIIEYCHGPVEFDLLTYPNDPLYTNETQWELSADNGIDAENAWSITHGNSNIIIGLMEPNGYPKNTLADLDAKVTLKSGSFNFIDHATKTASVAGAETNNNTGMASLNADGLIYAYTWELDPVDPDNDRYVIGSAIEDAVDDGCHILSISFQTIKSGLTSCGQSKKTMYYYKPWNYKYVSDAIEYAVDEGVIVVAAAGNNFGLVGDNQSCVIPPAEIYPASYSGVIAVSASNEDEEFVENFNYGSFVDINAPGEDVTVLGLNGSFTQQKGTSYSAPMVSALIALLLSEDSSLDLDEIMDIFKQTSDKLGNYSYTNGWNNHWGFGRINAYHALLGLGDGVRPNTPTNLSITTVPWGTGSTYRPKLTWTGVTGYDIDDYEIWRKLGSNGTWTKISTTNWDVNEYIDFTLVIFSSGNWNTAYYKICAIDRENLSSYFSSEVSISYRIDLNNGEFTLVAQPNEFSLQPCYPNPFNPTTSINYSIQKESKVTLIIYNTAGKEIQRLVDKIQTPSRYNTIWNGKNKTGQTASSGIYFYRINAIPLDGSESFIKTNKMIFAK